MKRSTGALLIGLTIFAFAVRLFLSLRGSIWADEGLVLNVVAIPRWHDMVRFLAFHESHPPFFYVITRVWAEIFDRGAISGLWATSIIGALIVPATFGVARAMVSDRTAVIASAFTAFSPSLAEHASLLRPYGLLPVLVVISTGSLYLALREGHFRQWATWALSTTLLLYTHHWAWLVFGGELAAGAWLARTLPRGGLRVALVGWASAIMVIGLAYLPWLRALLFQVSNTGHGRLQLEGVEDIATYYVVAFLNLPNMVFRATYPPDLGNAVLVAAVAAFFCGVIAKRRGTSFSANPVAAPDDEREHLRASRFLIMASVVPLAVAVLTAARFSLLFERCVAMVAPLLLIAGSQALSRLEQVRRPLFVAMVAFVIVLGGANIAALATSERSNAGRVAALITRERKPGDVVLVSPEWIAPSFNFYFPPSVEQMDAPHPGRSGLIDFARVGRRPIDSGAVERVNEFADRAAAAQRRVWLVTSRAYLNFVRNRLPTFSPEQKKLAVSAVLLDSVMRVLSATHGHADSSFVARGPFPRYEELIPLLFTPQPRPGVN
jgi:hypothetical protein